VVPDIGWEFPKRLQDDRSVTIFNYSYTSIIQISNATLYDSTTLRCFVRLPGPQGQIVYSGNATLVVSSKVLYDFRVMHVIYELTTIVNLSSCDCNQNKLL